MRSLVWTENSIMRTTVRHHKVCRESDAYLSTLPHKSWVSGFWDHFPVSKSYLKNKTILPLLKTPPDYFFIVKIENKAIFFLFFLRMFTVCQGEGQSHFLLELTNFRSFSTSCKLSVPKVVIYRKDSILQLSGSLWLDVLTMHHVIGQSCVQ